ncbi:hypothetical protein EON66_09620 [archaeon]|nr:MAG: hypothetical protein EON66_09620 [archaeon]
MCVCLCVCVCFRCARAGEWRALLCADGSEDGQTMGARLAANRMHATSWLCLPHLHATHTAHVRCSHAVRGQTPLSHSKGTPARAGTRAQALGAAASMSSLLQRGALRLVDAVSKEG